MKVSVLAPVSGSRNIVWAFRGSIEMNCTEENIVQTSFDKKEKSETFVLLFFFYFVDAFMTYAIIRY